MNLKLGVPSVSKKGSLGVLVTLKSIVARSGVRKLFFAKYRGGPGCSEILLVPGTHGTQSNASLGLTLNEKIF